VSSIKKDTSYHKNYYPDERSGICVIRRKGETDDELIRRFRKKYSKSGLAKELRDRMYYEKPSEKRRRKKMQSIRLLEREALKQQEIEDKYEKFKQKKARYFAKKKRKEANQNDSSSSGQNNSTVHESDEDKGGDSSS
jgi:small subunit ribosomal protein S21